MNYKSYQELISDSIQFATKIPLNYYNYVLGVPRSGLIPATIIAQYLHLPLYGLYTENSRVKGFSVKERSRILIVDDSYNSGGSIKRFCNEHVHDWYDIACVYITPKKEIDVTYYYKKVGVPRIFEWNIFNSAQTERSCIDMDGVICEDYPYCEQEGIDKRLMEHYLNSKVLFPIKTKIHSIVTSRKERYREVTMKWLDNNGVKYNNLIMYPREERTHLEAALHKAHYYRETEDCNLFIESSLMQAREIRDLTKKSVFCTDTMKMVGGSSER